MIKKLLCGTILLAGLLQSAFLFAADRADELKDEMWNTTDKDFSVVAIPQKWATKSAVIIAQLNRFEYKKALMASVLRINQYNHYRIKLLDKNAINEYAEISFRNDQAGMKIYVGFKVIKPNGKEMIVDLASAVTMEREGSGGSMAYRKIAIPNLEPGDILDYYICEESVIPRTADIQFFEPVIHNLPQEYPVMKQKLQFRAQRRCYINLRSLNGAPELKLVTDEANDEQYYSLEDSDREGIADVKWLYPNRELPTVKFRASYASGKGMRSFDVLLGNPGEVKSSVTKQELADLTATMMRMEYSIKNFSKYMKKKHKGVKDPFEVAKAGYYYYRNIILQEAEDNTLEEKGLSNFPDIKFTDVFSTFLASKKIPHDIVIAVPRNISALDDVVLENELEYLVRVKKGDEYLYFSPMNIFSLPGTIAARLEGTDAYALDGLVSPGRWSAKRITLPVTKAEANTSEAVMTVTTSNLSTANIAVKRTLTGINKLYGQYIYLDVYDAINEDNTRFDEHKSFNGYLGSLRKKYEALKQAYLAKRDKTRTDNLKEALENEFDFKVKDPANFKIEQTGRYDNAPAMVYSFDFASDDLIKKAGPNYLVDIGKLIEKQVKIEGDELKRDNNVYFDNARAFRYKVIFEIPKGYTVQGLDKFNQRVETKTGGFTSTAKEENGKVIIDTYKHYDVNFAAKDQWKGIVDFLNAANTFTEQKLLLKKK